MIEDIKREIEQELTNIGKTIEDDGLISIRHLFEILNKYENNCENTILVDYIKDDLGKDEWWCNWWICPNCHNTGITYDFNYCPYCGKEIVWKNKED